MALTSETIEPTTYDKETARLGAFVAFVKALVPSPCQTVGYETQADVVTDKLVIDARDAALAAALQAIARIAITSFQPPLSSGGE